MSRTLLPGKPYPLGATALKKGTNFAIFSEAATHVEVCLFDADGNQTDCVHLRERTAFVWHGSFATSSRASFTAFAPTAPGNRKRATASTSTKLLVDPYAKAISGKSTGKLQSFPMISHQVIP